MAPKLATVGDLPNLTQDQADALRMFALGLLEQKGLDPNDAADIAVTIVAQFPQRCYVCR